MKTESVVFHINNRMVILMARDLGYKGGGGVWECSSYLEDVTGWLIFACPLMHPKGDDIWFFTPRDADKHNRKMHRMFQLKYSEYLC